MTSDDYLQNSAIWISGFQRKQRLSKKAVDPAAKAAANFAHTTTTNSRQFRQHQSRRFRQRDRNHDPPIEG